MKYITHTVGKVTMNNKKEADEKYKEEKRRKKKNKKRKKKKMNIGLWKKAEEEDENMRGCGTS